MRIITLRGKRYFKSLEKRGTCMCKSVKLYDYRLIGTMCNDCKSTIVDAHVSQFVLRPVED